jgi:PST family polysaccharide transporter
MLAFKAVRGAGWLVLSRFVGRVIDFFTLLVLARILSPQDFGVAALATSLVVIIDTILEVPVTQALVRLRSIEKSHLDTGFTLGFLRSIAVAIVVFAIAWPFAHFNDDAALIPLVSVLVIGPIAKGYISPAMVYFARELRFRPTFFIEVAGKIGACVVVAIVVMSGGTYWAIVSNFATASVIATVFSYVMAPYRPAFSLARLSDFMGFIGWFSAAQLVAALNWQSDRFLIGGLADKASLGRYAVASDVSIIPTQSVIGPAMQPVMAAFSQVSQDSLRMKMAFLKAVRLAMLISVPACVGISLTADLVTDLLLGSQWKDAAPILSILALSIIPVPYFQTLYSASLALDRPNVLFKLNVIDLCFRAVLLPAGFYLSSIMGVGIARVVLAAIMFGFYLRNVKGLLQLGIADQLKNIWKVFAAGLAMALSVLLLRAQLTTIVGWYDILQLGLIATIGAAVYGLTLVLLGERLNFR